MEIDDLFETHPVRIIPRLRDLYGDGLTLHFSRYAYVPRDRKDKRETFSVSIAAVTPSWLRTQFLALGPSQELAFHSNIEIEKKKRHLPMLDFRGMTKGQLTAVMDVFRSDFSEGIEVYFSGRSYHAYFPRLLTRNEWIKFMGSALLCNSPNDTSVVDQRWVGHRLIGGYSALRWSCNTPHYRSYPKSVELDELDKSFAERRTHSGIIHGVARANQYYEELVEIALKEIGVEYSKDRVIASQLNAVTPQIDFFVQLKNSERIAVEAIYCREKYLTGTQLNKISRLLSSIRTNGIEKCILITNGFLPQANKTHLHADGVQVNFIEGSLDPSDLSARLKEAIFNLDA